jgi:hypothetical protein
MAELHPFNPGSVIQYSPGVATREIDLTNFVKFQGISGGAYVGEFVWGPVESDLTVSDIDHLLSYYGKPNDQNFVDWFSAYNFLSYANNLKVVRVVTEQGVDDTASKVFAYNSAAEPVDPEYSGVLIKNETHYHQLISDADTSTDAYDAKQFAARYPGVLGNSIRVSIADSATFNNSWEFAGLFDFAPGTSDFGAAHGAENDEVHIVITDEHGKFTGVKGAVLEKYAFLSKASDGKNLDNSPIFYGNVLNTQSSYVWYLGPPAATELAVSLTGDKVKSVAITAGGSDYETAPTVAFSAPPGSGATATATLGTGSRIDKIVSISATSGGTGYLAPPDVTVASASTTIPNRPANILAILGTGDDAGKVVGFQIIDAGFGYGGAVTVTFTPKIAKGTATISVAGAVTGVTITDSGAGYASAPTITFTGGGGSDAAATAVLISHNEYDWDQSYIDKDTGKSRSFKSLSSVYAKTLTGGTDGDRPTANEIIQGWTTLRDPEKHEISLLFTGSAGGKDSNITVNQYVIDNIAEFRKDCVVFCSPAFEDVVNKTEAIALQRVLNRRNDLKCSSNYAVMDSGWKLQYDQFNDKYRWMPLNPDIAGLCASTDVTNDPWWSPAGFNRGKIKNCVSLAFNPNKTSRDELYKIGINPVVTFVGDGTVLYGDKTLQYKPSAFSWINVRRLFLILKKSLAFAAKYHLFEFNDRFTRAQFVNMVEPFLREVKGRRGIYDYKIICDDTNNTGEVIDRGEFVADILIKPARSINYITLNLVAVKTGVDFNEIINPK